jgi:uncharacterized protein
MGCNTAPNDHGTDAVCCGIWNFQPVAIEFLMDRAEVIAKLKSVEPQLRAHGVAALYLFGSYARDEARQDSDVDVFVDPGTHDFYSLSHFVGAYEVIRDAVPGREVGYGTRNGLSKYIRPDVEQEAIRIF